MIAAKRDSKHCGNHKNHTHKNSEINFVIFFVEKFFPIDLFDAGKEVFVIHFVFLSKGDGIKIILPRGR